MNGDAATPLRDGSLAPNGSPLTNGNGINGESGKSSKPKTHPSRTSLNEMKRRVAAILEFVSRAAGEKGTHARGSGGSSSGSRGAGTPVTNGATSQPTSAGSSTSDLKVAALVQAVEAIGGPSKDYKDMDSKEMMLALKQELVGWEGKFGRWGEK